MAILAHSILSTLIYYDLLDRPLTDLEIYKYLLSLNKEVEPRRRDSAALLFSVAGRNPAPKAMHHDHSSVASITRWPSGAGVSFFDFQQTLAEIVQIKKICAQQGLYFISNTGLTQFGHSEPRILRGEESPTNVGRRSPASAGDSSLHSVTLGMTTSNYADSTNRYHLLKIREKRLKLSQLKWKKLKKLARWLTLVPFLRLAAVTGSLTAYNTRQESDFDLLIVAKTGRLWLTRTMVTALTELLGARRHGTLTKDRICLNCYLTEDELEIKPQAKPRDFHSAQEYGRLTPILEIKEGVYQNFLQKNTWLREYLSFYPWPNNQTAKKIKPNRLLSLIRKTIEWSLNEAIGDWLEKTLNKWQIKRINQKIQTEPADQIYVSNQCLMFHPKSKSYELVQKWQAKINQITVDYV